MTSLLLVGGPRRLVVSKQPFSEALEMKSYRLSVFYVLETV
jgi:hypothetical protein